MGRSTDQPAQGSGRLGIRPRAARRARGLRRARTLGAALSLAALGAGLLAGCGGSGSGNGGGNGGSHAAGGAAVNGFATAARQAMQGRPAAWQGPTRPAPAPAGVKLAAIVCDATLPGCSLDGAVAAAKQLGWSVTSYNGQSNPDVQNQSILAAVASGARAIVMSGIDPRLVQRGLQAAKRAGIVVGSVGQGGFSPTPKLPLAPGQANVDFDVSADWTAMGRATADALVADAGGKAHVLMLDDPEFFSVGLVVQGARAELAKCAGCQVHTMKIAAAQLTTTLPQTIVGFLQSHQDYDYVYAPFDGIPLTTIPAIKQAGLQVKMTGLQGNAPDLDFIRKGTVQFADVAFAIDYTGWAAIDQTIRLLDHRPLSEPVGEQTPWKLFTQANVAAAKGTYAAPFDYRSRFLALWKR